MEPENNRSQENGNQSAGQTIATSKRPILPPVQKAKGARLLETAERIRNQQAGAALPTICLEFLGDEDREGLRTLCGETDPQRKTTKTEWEVTCPKCQELINRAAEEPIGIGAATESPKPEPEPATQEEIDAATSEFTKKQIAEREKSPIENNRREMESLLDKTAQEIEEKDPVDPIETLLSFRESLQNTAEENLQVQRDISESLKEVNQNLKAIVDNQKQWLDYTKRLN